MWEITITCHDGTRLRLSEWRDPAPHKGDVVETLDTGQIIKARIDAYREEKVGGSSTRRRSFSECICQITRKRRKRARIHLRKRAAEEPSAGSAEFDGSHALVRSRRVPSANCSSYRGVPNREREEPDIGAAPSRVLNGRALVTASGARIDAVYRWWSRGRAGLRARRGPHTRRWRPVDSRTSGRIAG